MSNHRNTRRDQRLSANITQAMFDRVEHIARRKQVPKSEVVREAVRYYLDSQEDLAGSRKHFTRSFQRRMDVVDYELELIILLLAFLTGTILEKQLPDKKLTIEGVVETGIEMLRLHPLTRHLYQAHLRYKRQPPTE
jgi:predicted DNA-binding protein